MFYTSHCGALHSFLFCVSQGYELKASLSPTTVYFYTLWLWWRCLIVTYTTIYFFYLHIATPVQSKKYDSCFPFLWCVLAFLSIITCIKDFSFRMLLWVQFFCYFTFFTVQKRMTITYICLGTLTTTWLFLCY